MNKRSAFIAGIVVFAAAIWIWHAGVVRADPAEGTAQPTLGAHVLVGQEQSRFDPVIHASLDTATQGSSLVAFVAGYADNDAEPDDSARNHWRVIARPVSYRGYENRFDVRGYVAEQARGGRGQRIAFAKHARPDGESTLIVVEARNAGRLAAAVQNYPEAGLRLASGRVHTDGPALLVAIWLGDSGALRHFVTAGDGFNVIDRFTTLPPNSAVQAVVATRAVDRAGDYDVHWYAAPEQGAILWLLAFERPAQLPAGNSNSKATPSTTR